ncbi:Hypothetical protein PHPALM_16877 [Phytophthora palmivora]|uniref:Elicitin n=1 Tax=Phytophthora palmivora TaxID=4796 RepID=A0A2P4XNN2_9STRA|nr:Hypothetical protein PHPALM_16877 [Phytophthora palmivora]
MLATRITALVVLTLFIGAQGLETAEESSCSGEEIQQVQTTVAAIRESLESNADSSSKGTTVPSSCRAALTFDASEEDGEMCASDCINWIEDVVDISTCGDEEMLMYQRRMTTYLTQCNERKQVRLQEKENDNVEYSTKLRGLAAGQPEGRTLGVNGLMDALLVVTLNNAL